MSKDDPFFSIFRAIGMFFSGLTALTGAAAESASYSIDKSLQKRRHRDRILELEAHYDTDDVFARNAALSRAAGFPDMEGFMEAFYPKIGEAANEHNLPEPVYSVRAALMTTVGLLYDGEKLGSPLPRPATEDPIDLAQYRDRLFARMKKTSNPETLSLIFRTLIDCSANYINALPTFAHDTSGEDESDDPPGPKVLLTDVFPQLGEAVYSVILPFYRKDICDLGLFTELRRQIEENQAEASKLAKKEVDPETYTGDDVVHAFLKRTPLENLFKVSIPFPFMDSETRFSGHWIIAPPGRGKTTLLHSMFIDDLPRRASIIILDSKGDLIEPIRKLKAVEDRLLLIEPDPDYPLALNPLDIPETNINHAVSLLEYIFSSLLEAKMTPLQMTLFRSVLPALVSIIPNPTLETFRDIVANGFGQYREYIAQLPSDQQEFFFDKQNGFESKTYTETRNQLIWRLQFMMTNPVIKTMFSALKTKLDIGREMDAGKVILVNNSKAILGDEGAEFFGRFFIALILAAAQQRSFRKADDKLPCYFYIDECHSVIARDPKIATILDECRSQKIALILAHQRTEQIRDANVLSALANCAIRFANSDDEAKYLADKLRTTPDFLRALPRGTFAAFVRDLTPSALALKIPYNDLSKLPQQSAAEQRAVRERMRRQFSFIPETHKAPEGALDARMKSPAVAEQPADKPIVPRQKHQQKSPEDDEKRW